jgi:RNA polymerase sigma factor (sigma-70 family)
MTPDLARVLRRLRRQPAQPADSDADLLTRFARRRDEDAFAALVARHGALVWNVCRRVVGGADAAEDCFQAVFLVLARRAASLSRPAAVASWLYGVAVRVARRARQTALAGRQAPPGLEPAAPRSDPLDELTARELLLTLDEEVQRLPEVYRLPVILCCLEGLSQEEAARRLGCTSGSIKGRLERGRRRLRDRLGRRGVALAAALGVLEASRCVAPAGLMERAAVAARVATAPGDVGLASPGAQTLAEGVLRAMATTKLKGIAAVVLAVGLLGVGTGALAFRLGTGEAAPPVKPADQPPQKKAPAAGQPKRPVAQATDEDAAKILAVQVDKLQQDLAAAWNAYLQLEERSSRDLEEVRMTLHTLGPAKESTQARIHQEERLRRLQREHALKREIAEARVRETATQLRHAEWRLRGLEPAPQAGGDMRRELEALRRELRELRRAVERQGERKGRAP